MEAKAIARNIRISPRKVKPVLDLIRGKKADVAMGIIKNTPKSACEYLEKLLASAIANAENNFTMDKESLVVSECFVCPASFKFHKRMMPRAKGRGDRIIKRTSHITVVVSDGQTAQHA